MTTLAVALRVLVVDDDVDSADMLTSAVSDMGYETATANNATAALELAERFKPQVALLDIGMPIMNGYELGQRLLAVRGERPLTLVAVSGFSTDRHKRAATAVGFAHYLVKPVVLDELKKLLHSICR